MKPTITGFLVGLVLVGAVAGLFGLFMVDLSGKYGVTYDNETLENYNKLQELSVQTEELQNETEKITTPSGIVDKLGAFFGSGYNALMVTKNSLAIYDDMRDDAFEQAQLGGVGDILKTALISVLIILFFVGIIVAILVKAGKTP